MLAFRITLEARNPARRCSRHYRVEAGTDRFGVWVVEISYGRIGTAGRSRSSVVRDEGEARHLARSILKRRAGAPRRLGVAYRIRELIDPEGVGRGLMRPPCERGDASRGGAAPSGRDASTEGT